MVPWLAPAKPPAIASVAPWLVRIGADEATQVGHASLPPTGRWRCDPRSCHVVPTRPPPTPADADLPVADAPGAG